MREEVESAIKTLGVKPAYADIQRVGRQLLTLPVQDSDVESTRSVRIALTSSFTIDPLAAALAVECHRLELSPNIYVDGYNLYRSHLLDRNSPLYGFNPDIVFLAAKLDSLIPLTDGTSVTEATVDLACSQVLQLVEAFRTYSRALLVVFNFATPHRFPYAISGENGATWSRAVNERLEQELASEPQVRLMDYDALCAYHGKARITNPKMHYMGGVEISETFLPEVSRQCMVYIRALRGLSRKCLVLDCDGTLWGGTVGEDGLEGIRLERTGPGSEYYEFQQSILDLFNRGVILAIASKNNPDDVLAVLREHSDMVLREDHFANIQVNWNDKASNIAAIAQEVNIGLDSIVFLDDSPTERAWVRQILPEVAVYDLPPDPSDYVRFVQELTDFEVLAITEEDMQRGTMYTAERARKQLQISGEGYEEFLASLQMRLTIGTAQASDVQRVGQLTRKTNQFNLTTKRYTDTEIADICDARDATVYTLRVEDVFGDSGLVGVAILRRSENIEQLDSFLMSCRVLGRGIESVFLSEVVCNAIGSGANRVMGEYLPTSKNGVAANFLRGCGFHEIAKDESESGKWQVRASEWTHSRPPMYEVDWRSGARTT